MEFKDYYQVLGVEKTATADAIKKAYRRAARKYHPDVSKEKDAGERMKEINEANAVLSDPEKRASYDSLGNRYGAGQEFQPPPDWGNGFETGRSQTRGADGAGPESRWRASGGENAEDFSDFFSSLFGRGGRGGFQTQGDPAAGAARGRAPSFRGDDHHARISIDLADTYVGATRSISLRAARVDESGHVVTDDRTLQVTIPRGVREGQQIRLAGQGSAGFNGGPAGDLFLEVDFNHDPRFHVDGRDVTLKLPVAPWEAALGATVEVPTPAGRIEVTIPADSQGGRRLRLRGKGIPGKTPGDLYLELVIVLPPASTEQARQLYQTMARELVFDPRATMEARP